MDVTIYVGTIQTANATKAIVRLTIGCTQGAPIPNAKAEPTDSKDHTISTDSVIVSTSASKVPTIQYTKM